MIVDDIYAFFRAAGITQSHAHFSVEHMGYSEHPYDALLNERTKLVAMTLQRADDW